MSVRSFDRCHYYINRCATSRWLPPAFGRRRHHTSKPLEIPWDPVESGGRLEPDRRSE